MALPATIQSVNPDDPTTRLPGKPARQDDIDIVLRDIQNRLERIEAVLQGGVLLTDSTGTVRRRLSINGSGAILLNVV